MLADWSDDWADFLPQARLAATALCPKRGADHVSLLQLTHSQCVSRSHVSLTSCCKLPAQAAYPRLPPAMLCMPATTLNPNPAHLSEQRKVRQHVV